MRQKEDDFPVLGRRGFTVIESGIAKLIGVRKTPKEIATLLDVTVNAVHAVQTHRKAICRRLMRPSLEHLPTSSRPSAGGDRRITNRELQVILFIGDGMTTKEIANTLGISCQTVSSYRKTLCNKLKVHSTIELMKTAVAFRTSPTMPTAAPDVT